MKFKDLVSVTKNNRNKQTNWSIKKKKLKELEISEDELLNMNILKEVLK